MALGIPGCSIKRTVRTEVPSKILQAKTAHFEELLDILQTYDKVYNLSASNLRLTFTFGKWESGKLDKYREAPGYILLRRPDLAHLVFQNPITKTAELDLLSAGDDLSVWIPSKNEFYMGKNSARELVVDDMPGSPVIPIRTAHIFEAILPQSVAVESPRVHVALTEETDARAKYYALSIFKEGSTFRSFLIRKIWIERSELTIARQQTFLDDGRMVSDIEYSGMIPLNGFKLPLRVRLDRPLEGYTLNMEFKSWRINYDMPDKAFVLTPPQGVKIIHLREKTGSDAL